MHWIALYLYYLLIFAITQQDEPMPIRVALTAHFETFVKQQTSTGRFNT